MAILHSVPTSLWRGHEDRWEQLSQRLNRAGIPYEVIVERDLTPEILRDYRAVIVSDVAAFNEAQSTALRDYVMGGGSVLFAGECGTIDDRGEARIDPVVQDLRGGERRFSYNVLTDLVLRGFTPEPDQGRLWIPSGTTSGRAGLRFTGPAGEYTVAFAMLDEVDGASTVGLQVNGRPIASWRLDLNNEQPRTLSARTALRPGDQVSIVARPDGMESCRLVSVSISDVRAGDVGASGRARC